jgi:quinol-cytochrome oxidoreductase complex cytochrome b subunit
MSERPRSAFWRWLETATYLALSAAFLLYLPPDRMLRVWNIAFGVFLVACGAWTFVKNLREQ